MSPWASFDHMALQQPKLHLVSKLLRRFGISDPQFG